MSEQDGLTRGEESFARRAGYGDDSVYRMHRASRPDRGSPRLALLAVVVSVLGNILIQVLKPDLGRAWALVVGLAVAAVLITAGVLLDRRRMLRNHK